MTDSILAHLSPDARTLIAACIIVGVLKPALEFAWRAVLGLWRGARGIGHGFRRAEDLWPVLSDLDTMARDVKEIRKQVFPNGGESMRDEIVDIRERLNRGDQEFEVTRAWIKEIKVILDRRVNCAKCGETSPLLRDPNARTRIDDPP